MNCMITKFAQFYRANADEETRYYPVTTQDRIKAREFDERTDPVIIGGFAVYDTGVSTDYAVALYSTQEEAEKHKPAAVEEAPDVIVAEEAPSSSKEDEKLSTSKPKKRKFGGKR